MGDLETRAVWGEVAKEHSTIFMGENYLNIEFHSPQKWVKKRDGNLEEHLKLCLLCMCVNTYIHTFLHVSGMWKFKFIVSCE